MAEATRDDAPAPAKVALVEPASLCVVWASDREPHSVSEGVSPESDEGPLGLAQVLPMAEPLALAGIVREVAENGIPRHVSVDLVSTGQGSMAYAVSAYRLPDGMVLIVAEHTWRPAVRAGAGATGRRNSTGKGNRRSR